MIDNNDFSIKYKYSPITSKSINKKLESNDSIFNYTYLKTNNLLLNDKYINYCNIDVSDILIYDNKLSINVINDITKYINERYIVIGHKSISDEEANDSANDSNNLLISKHNLYFQSINCIYNNYLVEIFFKNILPFINIKDKEFIEVHRCYANTHTHGCSGQFHYDGKLYYPKISNKRDIHLYGYTVLLFLSENWNINYDGSTSIYLDNTSINKTFHVENKNGRICVFPSYMYHKACDISSYSIVNSRRIVLAFHLIYNEMYLLEQKKLI